jgi:hypothetical protein
VRRRALLALLVATLCASIPSPAFSAGDAAEPLLARAYELRHRSLTDAAVLVNSELSPEGSVKMQLRLRTLVVEDHPSVLDRIDALLKGFDVPPRNVEVTLTLLLGSDAREGESANRTVGPREISREIRGVSEALGDFTKWTDYSLLGSQSVTGIEGRSVTARLSEEYRVTLEVESVQPPTARAPQGMITLRSLVLQKVVRLDGGGERVDDLYSTAIKLHAGKLLMVGAARSPESRKALFLTIKARPV